MKNVTLSMPEDLLQRGREHAARKGTTLNQLLRDLLAKEIEEKPGSRFLKMIEQAEQTGLRSNGPYLTRDEAHER
jgi:hypothetical protein